jgi:hypothetical protein
LVTLLLVSFDNSKSYDSTRTLFRAIYDSQNRYFKDSLDSNIFYEGIIDFSRKSRQKIYNKYDINISELKTYIILEGQLKAGVVCTGIVFEEDKEIAYTFAPAKGWQVATFKKSEFVRLSNFTNIDTTTINKVGAWDTFYIYRQKNTIGGTGVNDGYSFIASHINNSTQRPIIETVGFGQFNILY